MVEGCAEPPTSPGIWSVNTEMWGNRSQVQEVEATKVASSKKKVKRFSPGWAPFGTVASSLASEKDLLYWPEYKKSSKY